MITRASRRSMMSRLLIGDPAQVGGLGGADADAEHEGGGQGRHHPEQGRDLEVDVGSELGGCLGGGLGGRGQVGSGGSPR